MIARIALALGALGLVSAALGDTQVVTATIDYTQTNWENTLEVPQFNVPGARLDSITLEFEGKIKSTIRLENRDQAAVDYTAGASYDITLGGSSAKALLDVHPGFVSERGTLSAYDGKLDFAGASGVAFNGVTSSAVGQQTLTSEADLAAFTGSGVVYLPVKANATDRTTASGNVTEIILTQAGASVKVTYNYTPYAPLGSLGDRLWFDANANGIQDANEKGLVGVGVRLLDKSGMAIRNTTTGADGLYLFDDLPAGDYRVQFDKPAGYGFVTRDAGTNDEADSDVDGSGLTPDLIHLDAGQNRLDVDAGVAGSLCLGDRVWKDLDRDGLQDNCEPGVPNVPVRLLDADGNVIAETKTDANGLYRFANVAAGDYTLDFDAPAGTGFTKPFADSRYKAYDSNADADTGEATVHLTNSDLTIDAGLVGAGKIGDTVWLDCDGDGKFDATEGEKGLKGVRVYLLGDLNGDGRPDVAASTVTDANGRYVFNSLYPGNYMVSVNPLDVRGLVPTYDLDGKNTAHYAIARLLPNADNLDFDFGYKPASCGGGASHCWWRCNPGGWPHACLWVGGKCHSKSTICNWMKVGDCADKSIALYQRLCAAKLNLGAGCDGGTVLTCGRLTCSVKDAIRKADAWLAAHPVGCRVSANSADWASIADCFGILDRFCGK